MYSQKGRMRPKPSCVGYSQQPLGHGRMYLGLCAYFNIFLNLFEKLVKWSFFEQLNVFLKVCQRVIRRLTAEFICRSLMFQKSARRDVLLRPVRFMPFPIWNILLRTFCSIQLSSEGYYYDITAVADTTEVKEANRHFVLHSAAVCHTNDVKTIFEKLQ